ncbi:hypothetical protein ABZ464_24890 [Streptomyces sp. NPDC005820]
MRSVPPRARPPAVPIPPWGRQLQGIRPRREACRPGVTGAGSGALRQKE